MSLCKALMQKYILSFLTEQVHMRGFFTVVLKSVCLCSRKIMKDQRGNSRHQLGKYWLKDTMKRAESLL